MHSARIERCPEVALCSTTIGTPPDAPHAPPPVLWVPIIAIVGSRGKLRKWRTFMKRIVLLLVSLCAVFLSTGCGPSDAEKRAHQVAQAKDDALKLRRQLAQAKSGADAETVRSEERRVGKECRS